MKGIAIKRKKKKAIFLCQIAENSLKVIKCLLSNNAKREFVGLEVEAIPPDIDDKELAERLNRIFKKLEYNNNPVIVSLPRSKAICRYLKVPTQNPKEIDNIVSLQASRYLPYPANELITGYQIISTDKEGYSDINLVIVHKDVIERLLRIFKELKVLKVSINLSSWGLSNFSDYLKPEEQEALMLVDIDASQVEVAIVAQNKVIFSRYFKVNPAEPNWESLFINEINKTRDAYLKEVAKEAPNKIMVINGRKTSQEVASILNKQAGLNVEVLSYDKINLAEDLLNKLLTSDNSFASIIGLGLKDVEEYLNLLPQEIKDQTKKLFQRKEWLRVVALIMAAVLIWGLGIAKNLDNKAKYLKQLNLELDKIAKEARPLEEIEKRLEFMQRRAEKKLSSLDVLYEIHQTIPTSISLLNLNYVEDGQIILRGQGAELNSIFAFVGQLEKSTIFKNFNIKVRYATKKRVQAGEVIDFEIVCLKK